MTFDFKQDMLDDLEKTIKYCDKLIYTDNILVKEVFVIKRKGCNFVNEYFKFNKKFDIRPSKQNEIKDQYRAENLTASLKDAFLFTKGQVCFTAFNFCIHDISYISLREAAIECKAQSHELSRKILQYE